VLHWSSTGQRLGKTGEIVFEGGGNCLKKKNVENEAPSLNTSSLEKSSSVLKAKENGGNWWA